MRASIRIDGNHHSGKLRKSYRRELSGCVVTVMFSCKEDTQCDLEQLTNTLLDSYALASKCPISAIAPLR